MSEPLLRMEGIDKSFPGVQALQQAQFELLAGEVHALMGENGAGKSTLMKVLTGVYRKDAGTVRYQGKEVEFSHTKAAQDAGISIIHQELNLAPDLTVAQNIYIGREPRMKGFPLFIDEKKLNEQVRVLLKKMNLHLEPDTPVADLTVAKQQMVEIAKALSFNAKALVMDEPTSSLTGNEVEHLFRIIAELKQRGVAIIYISHKMEEILRISDEVTIMRDGKKIGTWDANELTTDLIISRMVGRDLTQRYPERSNVPGEVVLQVDGFTSSFPKSFRDVSFELRRGEILGVGGLVGAQRTELIEALYGIRSLASGTMKLHGKPIRIRRPVDAIRHKMALLTEERRVTGIFPVLSVLENTVIANQKRYLTSYLLLEESRRRKDTDDSIERLRVKTPSAKTQIHYLSGGNQQKVLLARWLLTEPDILLLDEPTRGIDVGAKFEIYTIIAELAAQGKSIVMISSEMPELLGMSDRIMVMSEGRLTGILDGNTATEEEIMKLAAQHTA